VGGHHLGDFAKETRNERKASRTPTSALSMIGVGISAIIVRAATSPFLYMA
jgi:hypothetical protein